MPKKIRDYLLKMKSPRPRPRPQIRLPSKNWNILSGCKHPRTPSFALYNGRNEADHVCNNKKDDAATLADVDRFLLENFKSLYLKDDQETFEEPPVMLETPCNLRGSTRFFVKAGLSGSLVEDALTTSDEAGSVSTVNDISSSNSYDKDYALPDNSIALLTHTTSPYEDFKRSMQQMVNNCERVVDWDFMEDLLFCYLNLNDKKSHKFILSAFVDLITVMRRNSEPDSPKPRSVRTFRTGRELRNRTNNVTDMIPTQRSNGVRYDAKPYLRKQLKISAPAQPCTHIRGTQLSTTPQPILRAKRKSRSSDTSMAKKKMRSSPTWEGIWGSIPRSLVAKRPLKIFIDELIPDISSADPPRPTSNFKKAHSNMLCHILCHKLLPLIVFRTSDAICRSMYHTHIITLPEQGMLILGFRHQQKAQNQQKDCPFV
ncbi:Transcription repressor OFP14, partial [Mucuna pruriens]